MNKLLESFEAHLDEITRRGFLKGAGAAIGATAAGAAMGGIPADLDHIPYDDMDTDPEPAYTYSYVFSLYAWLPRQLKQQLDQVNSSLYYKVGDRHDNELRNQANGDAARWMTRAMGRYGSGPKLNAALAERGSMALAKLLKN
jgi:hypothetical protein